MLVCPLHWYFRPSHVDDVAAEMARRGPPRLHGFFDRHSGAFLLREGTHRIRAAHRLGLAPVLVSIPWWRAKGRLSSARIAAERRGLSFPEVVLEAPEET